MLANRRLITRPSGRLDTVRRSAGGFLRDRRTCPHNAFSLPSWRRLEQAAWHCVPRQQVRSGPVGAGVNRATWYRHHRKIEYPWTGPHVDRGREHHVGTDLAVVTRADLRRYYFLSGLSFRINEPELTPPWSWTPMFDILRSMKGVLEYLERGEHSTIGFTENAELIEFVPEDGKVVCACSLFCRGRVSSDVLGGGEVVAGGVEFFEGVGDVLFDGAG